MPSIVRTMARSVLMLSETNVRDILLSSSSAKAAPTGMMDCLQVNRQALISLVNGRAQVPTRIGLPYFDNNNPMAQEQQMQQMQQQVEVEQQRQQQQQTSHDHSHDHGHSHGHGHGHAAREDGMERPYGAASAAGATPSAATAPFAPQGPEASDWSLFKPASYLSQDYRSTERMGVKVVSVRSGNASRGLSIVPASIMVLDPRTGVVDAVVGATHLTAARTAAGSALATQRVLQTKPSPKLVRHLVLFGAGLQAEYHVRTIHAAMTELLLKRQQSVRDNDASLSYQFPKITIVNRSLPRAEALREMLLQEGFTTDCNTLLLEDRVGIMETLSMSANPADVVVACTNTMTPLFLDSVLPGCHINGVGSYTPEMQEVPARVVERCRVYVDTLEAKKVGDLACLANVHPVSLLGQELLKQQQQGSGVGTEDESMSSFFDCTFYKAVGTAIQDVLMADYVVQKARELNIGTEVDMS